MDPYMTSSALRYFGVSAQVPDYLLFPTWINSSPGLLSYGYQIYQAPTFQIMEKRVTFLHWDNYMEVS